MNCMNHYTGLGEVPVTEEAVILPITADTTGTWAFMSSFNGAYQYVQFACTAGHAIVVPARLNESYTYTFRLYKPDATILNDTYYSMLTIPLLGVCSDEDVSSGIIPKVGRKQFVATEGQTAATYLDLVNATQVVVFIEGAILQEGAGDYEYTFNASAGTIAFNTPLQEGQNITLLYFK